MEQFLCLAAVIYSRNAQVFTCSFVVQHGMDSGNIRWVGDIDLCGTAGRMRLRPPMQAVRSRFRCQKSAFSQQHIWIGRVVDRDLPMIAAKCDRRPIQDSERVKFTQQAVQKTACALDSLPYLR